MHPNVREWCNLRHLKKNTEIDCYLSPKLIYICLKTFSLVSNLNFLSKLMINNYIHPNQIAYRLNIK